MPARHTHRQGRNTFLVFVSLVALILIGSAVRAAEPQPDPSSPRPEMQQSMERSRMAVGLPPHPEQESADRNVKDRKATAAAQAIMKAKFDEAKQDANTLAELAQSLKSDLDKSSPNIVSVSVAEKAEQIEKLAKKIKKWCKAY